MVTWRAAALVAAGALTLPVWPAPWLGAALLVALVLLASLVDSLLAARLRDLALDRDGDKVVRLGETVTVRLRVRNRGHRLLRAEVRDAWVPSAGAAAATSRVSVAPGGVATLPVTLTPTRRGDRPAVRVTVRSYGPLGLAFRQRVGRPATPPWTVRVLPRFASRRFLPEKTARLRVFDGALVTRGRGQGTEFDALREYVIGDDVRSSTGGPARAGPT
jgi:uncharacterized protein (DUF58 family)